MHSAQCGISPIFVSRFFVKILKIFRENNTVKGIYIKMTLEMLKFSKFGANLRKFNLHGLIEKGLDY